MWAITTFHGLRVMARSRSSQRACGLSARIWYWPRNGWKSTATCTSPASNE